MVRAARTTLPRVFYHVVCEGGSEVFYINKLAQFLTNNGIHPEKTLRAHSPLVSRNNCTLTDPRHLLKRAMDIRRDKGFFYLLMRFIFCWMQMCLKGGIAIKISLL